MIFKLYLTLTKLSSIKKVIHSNRSAVAQWLELWPLVLEVPGSIPAGGEENLVSEHVSLRVICRDDMKTVLRIETLYGGSLCRDIIKIPSQVLSPNK